MNLRRFTIGDTVLVKATAHAVYGTRDKSFTNITDGRERVIVQTEWTPPKAGIIVGISRIQEGTYSPASGGHRLFEIDEYSEHEPACLMVSKAPYVWLVRFCMTGKAVKVLDEDIEKASYAWFGGFPLVEHPCEWREENRKWLKDESKKWARDEKGRWVKS